VDDILDQIDAATARLYGTVGRLTDDDARGPSLLPGWSRGHVLNHIARSGDALRNLLNGRATYANDQAREADIEAGAGRTLADLVLDLRTSADAFGADVRARTDWAAEVSIRGGTPFAKSHVLVIRLVELELHHVDLDTGYTAADWPETFATLELPHPQRGQRADRAT
jgi:maleylpyruvate isomerase